MCNSKAQGGGRCLAHAALSKFVMRLAVIKTGAPMALVREATTELRKEGANVPDPSIREVKSWIDAKRFATQFDPDLSDHDRTVMLSQLERATEEAENNGVKGQHFHVWKNLLDRVKEKFTMLKAKLGRPAIVIGMAGVMSATVAGCFATNPDTNNTPAPAPSSSISQPATPAPEVTTEAPAETFVNGDDVIPGEVITDAHGPYTSLSVNPESPAMKLNPAVIDESVYANGFTDEQVLAGQQYAVGFITEQVIDSEALDGGPEAYNNWIENYARGNVIDGQLDALSGTTSFILRSDDTMKIPTLIRDGGPRVKSYDVKVTSVKGGTSEEGAYLLVNTNVTVSYRVTDEGLLQFAKDNVMVGGTDENILSFFKDEAKDGQGENVFTLNMERENGVGLRDGSWKLGGFTTNNLSADIRDSFNL